MLRWMLALLLDRVSVADWVAAHCTLHVLFEGTINTLTYLTPKQNMTRSILVFETNRRYPTSVPVPEEY